MEPLRSLTLIHESLNKFALPNEFNLRSFKMLWQVHKNPNKC